MRTFYKQIDKRSRQTMTEYLKDHFRYDTMNSWNQARSYAHNMKIHRLGLDSETQDKLYDLIQCDGFFHTINNLKVAFSSKHNWLWQARFNGKSGGYLVLYQGEKVPSGYKSYCLHCGQLNWTSISENSGKCGACGNERKDFATPHMVSKFTGRGIDEYEDFDSWDMCDLRARVELVQSFDQLADDIVAEAIYLANNHEVIEEEYTESHTRLVMV